MTMSRLKNHLLSNVRFEEEDLNQILFAFKVRPIKKGERLLNAGSICRKLWFIETGCARTFTEDAERDVTSWFYFEDQFLTAWHSFLLLEPSFENIEVLEDGNLYEISYEGLQSLYTDIPAFERFGRLLAEKQLAYIDHFSRGYLFLSAKERYQLLLNVFPDVELRVMLGHISSFLGISRETLSRIRSGK